MDPSSKDWELGVDLIGNFRAITMVDWICIALQKNDF